MKPVRQYHRRPVAVSLVAAKLHWVNVRWAAVALLSAVWLWNATTDVSAAEPPSPPAKSTSTNEVGDAVGSPMADALALLEQHCVVCHGGAETKGELDLTTRESLLRGGACGDTVDLENPAESYLIQTVRHEIDPYMPFKKPKLSEADAAILLKWVELGAKYDRKLEPADGVTLKTEFEVTESDRQHWAFVPVQRPPVPEVDGASADIEGELANPIDRFILGKLQVQGLTFSPEANRETFIRRVTLDLIGLPPTPAEIDAFLSDKSPDAHERLIDRLLASPGYGERWGRHWLDLARYAETDGFEHDAVRPNSWRYRDYVIRSFNDDKPYDRFILEQIAGDELWPGDADALIATGFNLLGPDMVDSSDQMQRRHNTLNDMTDTASLAFLGLTLGCARCHDHKFEPISQRDYYSFQAHFTSVEFAREKSIATDEEKLRFDAEMEVYRRHPMVRALAKLERPIRMRLRRKKMEKLSPEAIEALGTPPEKRTTAQANLALETESALSVSDSEMLAAMDDDLKSQRQELLQAVEKVPHPQPVPTAIALSNGPLQPTFVLNRGDYTQPGEEVPPEVPEVLRSDNAAAGDAESPASIDQSPSWNLPSSGQRTELAEWIASPENPLTARVMVNRIWQHHFGHGIVPTPSNFGTHGVKPTHPELLDWLAAEFVDRGWSIKEMHRLMLSSRTYRQCSSAASDDKGNRIDPDNTLYWRMNRLRLEGEAIRDMLLSVSGQLNPEMGGPSVRPPLPSALSGVKGWQESRHKPEHFRRSVYIFARRNLRFPFLEVFDAPDNNLSCAERDRSTTAPQSLTLLNSEESTQAAAAMADRLTREADGGDEQITLAFRLALGRKPSAEELEMSKEFLTASPLSELCRALFNMNDFVYVE